MKPKRHDACIIAGCTDPVRYPVAGLCAACYQWDHSHRRKGHGIAYFVRYQAKNQRLAARVGVKLAASKVRQLRRA